MKVSLALRLYGAINSMVFGTDLRKRSPLERIGEELILELSRVVWKKLFKVLRRQDLELVPFERGNGDARNLKYSSIKMLL